VLTGGIMSIFISGSITYPPKSSFTGFNYYAYKVCDATTCSSGIITFIVSAGSLSGTTPVVRELIHFLEIIY
jgi:hypothetical protein